LALPSEAFAMPLPIIAGIGILLGSKLFLGAVVTVVSFGLLAQFGPGIAGDIGAGFLNALIGVIYIFPLIISATFYMLATVLLMWVIDPNFMGIGITRPENVVAFNAWTTVRDFANMGFILALVAIGLGTALRYGEYQLQKALPLLIIIALLINFTPVMMGILIDAANITIGFLVQEAVGKNLWEQAKIVYEASFKPFVQITDDPTANLAAATAQLIFNIVGTLITLLFFILFFFRYVALMILFILSPLAFFSYILPITRPFWNLWWHQFISWLLVGVVGAFFLWLAASMTQFMWDVTIPSAAFEGGPFQWFADFFAVFVVAVLPIAILYLGFFFTLSTTAMGARQVISAGKKAGAWTGKRAGARTAQWGRKKWEESETARRFRERMTEEAKVTEPRLAWGEGKKGPIAFAQKVAAGVARAGVSPIWATRRAAGRTMGEPGFMTAGQRKITEAAREVEKESVATVVSKLKSPGLDAATKIGYINQLIKRGPRVLDEAIDVHGLTQEEIEATIPVARQYDAHRDIISAMPHLEEQRMRTLAGVPLAPSVLSLADRKKLVDVYGEEIIRRIRPDRAAQVSRQVLKYDEATKIYRHAPVLESMVRTWDGRHMGNFVSARGTEAMDAIERTVSSQATAANQTPEQWLEQNNPRLLKYMRSQAGQGLGFTIKEEKKD